MGRLHRHPRQRPAGLTSPRFTILGDASPEGAPPETFGSGIESVYDRYILLRTWLVLRGREMIGIPREIEKLIETVYKDTSGENDELWLSAMEKARSNMEGEIYASKCVARQLLIGAPQDPADLIEQFNSQLIDEEDPSAHTTIKAATREGDPSITVVMVPENTIITFDPTVAEVRKLLDCCVKLSHKELFQHFLHDREVPEEWKKNAHLRYARLLRLDGENQGRVGNYILTVDKQLGVVIEKKEA
jgi:CRISPR-associated endonuclease/helicase Cas3